MRVLLPWGNLKVVFGVETLFPTTPHRGRGRKQNLSPLGETGKGGKSEKNVTFIFIVLTHESHVS